MVLFLSQCMRSPKIVCRRRGIYRRKKCTQDYPLTVRPGVGKRRSLSSASASPLPQRRSRRPCCWACGSDRMWLRPRVTYDCQDGAPQEKGLAGKTQSFYTRLPISRRVSSSLFLAYAFHTVVCSREHREAYSCVRAGKNTTKHRIN